MNATLFSRPASNQLPDCSRIVSEGSSELFPEVALNVSVSPAFTSIQIQGVRKIRPIGRVTWIEFSPGDNSNRLWVERCVQFPLINMPLTHIIPGKGNVSPVRGYIESRVDARDSEKLGKVQHTCKVLDRIGSKHLGVLRRFSSPDVSVTALSFWFRCLHLRVIFEYCNA